MDVLKKGDYMHDTEIAVLKQFHAFIYEQQMIDIDKLTAEYLKRGGKIKKYRLSENYDPYRYKFIQQKNTDTARFNRADHLRGMVNEVSFVSNLRKIKYGFPRRE